MLLLTFSLLPLAQVQELIAQAEQSPAARLGQRALASEITALVHGDATARDVEAAAQALFGAQARQGRDGLVATSADILASALAEAPGRTLGASEHDGAVDAVTVLVAAGVVDSKGAARRAITEGGAYINNERVESDEQSYTRADLIHGKWLVARRGKRTLGWVDGSSLAA